MAGFNPAPFLRRVAAIRPLYLGVAYAVVGTIVLLLQLYLEARPQAYAVRWIAWILAVGGVSILLTVFAWYRDDDLLEASVLLLAITGIGTLIAQSLVSVVVNHSFGAVILLAVPSLFAIFLRLLVLSPFVVGFLWLLRKARHWFAPDTEAAT